MLCKAAAPHYHALFSLGSRRNLNDILIPHLKAAFGLWNFQSSFIQIAFFGGYFIAAFRAGWLVERVGYKRGINFLVASEFPPCLYSNLWWRHLIT
jgi:fucose permease